MNSISTNTILCLFMDNLDPEKVDFASKSNILIGKIEKCRNCIFIKK